MLVGLQERLWKVCLAIAEQMNRVTERSYRLQLALVIAFLYAELRLSISSREGLKLVEGGKQFVESTCNAC